jgi:purine-nucleoside phosphorylase
MTLIHTALYPEAKPIIEYFELKQIQTQPFKIYKNEKIVLVVAGWGKERTVKNLEMVFSKYKFEKAINIGICGCKEKEINIGSVFSVDNNIEGIMSSSLTTVDEPLDDRSKLDTLLVDMEAEHFKNEALKYVNKEHIYIIKVVSDHLDKAIPKKSFVNMLINDSIEKWSKII